ncbi:MAG: HdeD family acid-resistance protein [Labilithrix sp.]|nr:HdeD family acid-resistance protein [Labilithrix sp.]MBX3222637.1 HdeD family acid-resistance protein [Labilithrix sp.]
MERDSTHLPTWSSLALRGVASILFGVLAFAWPGITLVALTLLFGAYAFVDGVTALVVAVQRGAYPHRWLLVVDGLIGIGAGIFTLFWPGITLLALILVIGVRFALMGALQIAAAIQLRRDLDTPFLYGLAGLASVALGVLAFVTPGLTSLVLLMMLAAYSLAFGVMLLVLAFRMRRIAHRIPVHAPA